MPRFTIDWRLIEIEYELWALGEMVGRLESQIDQLQQQTAEEIFEKLRASGWADDEGEQQLALQDIAEIRDYVVPRFTRGPYLVALWACYEAGVTEVADFLRRQKAVDLELRELRGSIIPKLRRYFQAVLKFDLDLDKARLDRLADLVLIRNSLAHANGQKRAMSGEQWKRVTVALERQGAPPDQNRGVVILTAALLLHAYEDVNASLRDLVNRARGGRPRRTEPAEEQVIARPDDLTESG